MVLVSTAVLIKTEAYLFHQTCMRQTSDKYDWNMSGEDGRKDGGTLKQWSVTAVKWLEAAVAVKHDNWGGGSEVGHDKV